MNSSMNNMRMDPSIFYGGGMGMGLQGDFSASQVPQNMNDASMTGMLEDGMMDDYDALPMALESGFDQGVRIPAPGSMRTDSLADSQALVSASNDVNMTGAGAGPLPTGFGAPSTQESKSGVTEFTKRRNWSQRVIEELRDFLHILTPDGRVLYVSPSSESLTGYPKNELIGKFIVDFIHPDDSGIFVREFNESIASGHPLRFFYRFRKNDDTYTIFESHGHPHVGSEAYNMPMGNSSMHCRGFFMMARPYPTKNAALLDSFLEHKIENERLMKRIEDLRREEAEEEDDSNRKWLKKQEGSTATPSEETDTLASSSIAQGNPTNPDVLAMPPPAKPSGLNVALTRQALEESNAGLRPDSITDKMARYEGATHIETIELLTGLRYQDGERSKGISTGAESPALIRGDAGIAIPQDKEKGGGDKKKKVKLPDEFVCTDCGTLDSPEWRKGPNGPKTLCNACGLRWAKKEKKDKKPVPGQPATAPLGPSTGSS